MSQVKCDMQDDCTERVTYIGEKGYVYCATHAPDRHGWERVRKMRPWEMVLIESGQPLSSYEPISKREHYARKGIVVPA